MVSEFNTWIQHAAPMKTPDPTWYLNLIPGYQQKAWLEHYQRLLNVEFDWDPDHLSYQPPVEGQPIPITIDKVKKAISQMTAGKPPGPSGIVVEMIQAASDMGASMIRDLAAAIIRDGKVPSDCFICLPLHGKGGRIGKGQLQ